MGTNCVFTIIDNTVVYGGHQTFLYQGEVRDDSGGLAHDILNRAREERWLGVAIGGAIGVNHDGGRVKCLFRYGQGCMMAG